MEHKPEKISNPQCLLVALLLILAIVPAFFIIAGIYEKYSFSTIGIGLAILATHYWVIKAIAGAAFHLKALPPDFLSIITHEPFWGPELNRPIQQYGEWYSIFAAVILTVFYGTWFLFESCPPAFFIVNLPLGYFQFYYEFKDWRWENPKCKTK